MRTSTDTSTPATSGEAATDQRGSPGPDAAEPTRTGAPEAGQRGRVATDTVTQDRPGLDGPAAEPAAPDRRDGTRTAGPAAESAAPAPQRSTPVLPVPEQRAPDEPATPRRPGVEEPDTVEVGHDAVGFEGDARAATGSAARRRRPALAARALPAACLLLIGALTAAAHLLAALRPGAPVATLGETRLAVATVIARGAELAGQPLAFNDRLAAVQLAVVQLLLPLADVSVVDAARWACLTLGAGSALLLWPVLRRLGVTLPASLIGVALLGVSLPALALHAGISAGAPAAFWLMTAAVLAVRLWGRSALAAALVAVLTAPLAGVALLALAAHLVLARQLRVSDRLRLPLGLLLGVAAGGVAAAAVSPGPLAGVAGPLSSTPVAVAGVVGGLAVVGLAWRAAGWLRPVFSAAALLLVAALVPGPSRLTAAQLVAPILVVAGCLLLDQVGEQLTSRMTAALATAAALLGIVLPTPVALTHRVDPASDPDGLITWLVTEPVAGTPVQADDLDRAELLAAGFPAARLRGLEERSVPGDLRLVSDRPDGSPGRVGCAGRTAVASNPRGTGGAPGAVCRTDGGAEAVDAEAPNRTRLGAALADNPGLQLSPPAATALRAGAVDPRLMLVLAAMTTAHRVAVEDFPVAEFDSVDVPRRRALLSVVDGGPAASSDLLQTWLGAQQPPYVPSLLRPEGTGLLVGYPSPPASGLLPN
ncbi:MAG TPA: hypothetical protein VNO83_10605 [Pseudonocardia sp.]|nr:hypothetical protein [Pseudonocardia sp.]